MSLLVEKAASLQLFEGESIKHTSHHPAVSAAREISQASAQHSGSVDPTARQVAHPFRLLFIPAHFQKPLTDGRQTLLAKRLLRRLPQGFRIGRCANSQRRLGALANAQL